MPVAQGASSPLNQPLHVTWRVHATDGLGNVADQPTEGSITGRVAELPVADLGSLVLGAVSAAGVNLPSIELPELDRRDVRFA